MEQNERIQKYEKYKTSIVTVKTSLKSIIKHDKANSLIKQAVKNVNKCITRRGKYELYMVNENNTSKMCCSDGREMEKFRKRDNPCLWKNDSDLCHGLLRTKCVTNNKSTGTILINRDLNGSLNIHLKAVYSLNNKKLPSYFVRKT